MAFASLYDLFETLPDEQAAIDHFRAIRWKNGAFCPYCGSTRIYHFSDNRTHKCGDCRQRFSIKVGTIFEDTKIPLRKWMAAIWLITSHRKGIASTQLARDINVTQKTAWFMLHQLRHAARTRSFNRPLDGDVEVDEAFFGGKEKNKHEFKRGKDDKVVVLGMLERGGELRAYPVKSLKRREGRDRRSHRTGRQCHDGRMARLSRTTGPLQSSHGQPCGRRIRKHFFAHVNGLEGVWSLLKRQVYGIHHFVSGKHLHRYVDEAVWRFNRRNIEEGSRVSELLARVDGRLRYADLIGEPA